MNRPALPSLPPCDAPVEAEALAAVEEALESPQWRLRFASAVEQRFEQDQAPARRRGLVRAGFIGLVTYDLFLFNDRWLRPEAFADAVLWRGGVFTSFAVLALAQVHRGLGARGREAVMGAAVALAMLGSCMILAATRSPAALFDPFTFGLILMAGNILLPLRFTVAAATSCISLLIAAATLLSHPLLPREAKAFSLALLTGTVIFTLLACYRIERSNRLSYLLVLREELRSAVARRTADAFATLSKTDPLTGLPNRRAFESALARRWEAARADHQWIALVMLDIDHFKRFNDRFGHPAGDDCLRRVAAALRATLRDQDLAARLGGEEFVALLQVGDPADLAPAAERLRTAVEALAIPHADGGVVSVSIGAVCRQPAAHAGPAADLVAAADAALYAAKRRGRNRCELAA